jgi:flagellar biosynthesis protein FlhG
LANKKVHDLGHGPGRGVRLVHLADIPADPSVRQAVMRRQLLMQTLPGCPAALAMTQLARKLDETVIHPEG